MRLLLAGALGLAVLVIVGGFLVWMSPRDPQPPPEPEAQFLDIVKERKELDNTVWKDEVLAQKYEDRIVRLWDELRVSKERLAVLGNFPFSTLQLGSPTDSQSYDLGITGRQYGGDGRRLSPADWQALLTEAVTLGHRLVQSEWHHSQFDPGPPARSTIVMVLHVENIQRQKSLIVTGDLEIQWEEQASPYDTPKAKTIDARNIRVLERPGPPAFKKVFHVSVGHDIVRPVLVHDLDQDGLSELILPSSNLVLWNEGRFRFRKDRLVSNSELRNVATALLADFTGDGRVDLICAEYPSLVLFVADEAGAFSGKPVPIPVLAKLETPSVLTAGDIDGDGDLDLWIAQYKQPYSAGQMPTPYYDANDGYPAYLLTNDGAGNFVDATAEAGLEKKRLRRTYGGSLVDIDGDHDLDLVVASDFAGLDVYQNDGKGRFTDITERFGDDRYAFGMALTFADYDGDQNLDFYLIGMSSTTARRLERLGIGREQFPEHQQKRSLMGYGNRLFLGDSQGAFQRAPFNDDVARTGWSWGTTSFDFDNDGDLDIYVANGHLSGKTAKDYCTRFWCHDIYTGSSTEDPIVSNFFKNVTSLELGVTSWNGFEHNVLLMNQAGRGFLNVAFLMDVASERDSRNVISDDLDGDGRRDLIVVGTPPGSEELELTVFQNDLPPGNNWIGVRLYEQGDGLSPLGAKVIVFPSGEKPRVTQIVSGDSFRSQHSNAVHFGLGNLEAVDRIEVHWPNRSVTRLEQPAINRYHATVAAGK